MWKVWFVIQLTLNSLTSKIHYITRTGYFNFPVRILIVLIQLEDCVASRMKVYPNTLFERRFCYLLHEKSASTKSKRVFPFHDSPFAIFKNIFHHTNHFSSGKFIHKHFVDWFFTYYWFVCDLMIYCISSIQLCYMISICFVKAIYPFSKLL